MKKLIERLVGAKVYANHNAIKGKKSSGREDYSSSHKNWRQGNDEQ